MRSHLNQYLFSPLFWIMSLLLMALFLMVVLLFTPIGPKIIASVSDSAIGDLKIKGVTGSVLSGLHVDEFSLESDVGIEVKKIDLNIDSYDIENKKIVADKLVVGELTIVVDEVSKTSAPTPELIKLPDFGLPINIDAELLQLDSLKIVQKIPNSEALTLLFQVEGILLKQAKIKEGKLKFESLEGQPTILERPLKIKVANGSLNMNQPHELSARGSLSFIHPILGSLIGKIQVGGTLTQYVFGSELDFNQGQVGTGTLSVNGEGDYKQVSLSNLEINSDHGQANATGNVEWDPEIRLDFEVDANDLKTHTFLPEWPATADAKIKYSGSFIDSRLENNIEILSLNGEFRDQQLSATGNITDRKGLILTENLEVQLGDNVVIATGALTEPLSLDLNIDAQNLTQLLPELSGKLKGRAVVKGEYNTPQIESDISANNLRYGDFSQGDETLFLNTNVGLENDIFLIKNLTANLGKNEIKLSGRATEPYDFKWDINVDDLTQITPLAEGKIEGEGTLIGTLNNLSSTLKVKADDFVINDLKQGDDSLFLEGDISLNESIIQLKSLIAKSGSNSINMTGQASEPVDLDVKINAQKLSEVSPDIAGRVTGTAKVEGAYDSPIIKTNLLGSQLAFKGTNITQSEVKLDGEIQLNDGIPIIKQLDSQIGNNVIQLSGRASSPFDLTWNIDSKNLSQILPELSGVLLVKGKLQGTIDNPIINATGDARNLKFDTFSLVSGNFTANTTNGIYRIKANLDDLKNSDQSVKKANVELNGTIENHTITAKVDHSDAKVDLAANGAWQSQRWTGVVRTLKLDETKAGDWMLQNPTKVSISQDGFSADQFCFASKKTKACSVARFSKSGGLTAKGTIQKTPLNLLQPFLPEGLTVNGDIEGSYDIKQNNGKPRGTIQFRLPKSSFSFKGEDGVEQSLSYENAEITANVNDRTIDAEAKITIINRGAIRSKARIILSPADGRHTINGSADFNIPNINFAQAYIPRSRGLRGALDSTLTFSGLLSKPQIKAQAKLKDGYLRLPEAGTEITNINLDLSANKPGQATIKGKMLMGKGVLNVTGDVNLKELTKWKANIKIRGDNIRFMNTNEVRAIMSPDIVLSLTPELVGITGQILIPEADIRLKNIPETSIDESTDTFVIGESKQGEKVTSVKIRPKVLVRLGNKVRMDAFGLKAKLSGDVNVTHNRRDILANGSLRVQDGQFQAYGQDLAINNGRLIFNGSPKLVGMDIRATRTIDEQIVGIHLGGTLLNPKSRLYAEPALVEESEILSYLITGNSLSSASGQESALLLSAVRGLGITGSGSIVQKIGSAFGLDDVNIVTKDDLRKSELALGKRLGSRLYVRYLIGLFDQTQKIAIEYKINDVLSLEAQSSSDDFGLDFIYEIERD